MNKFFRNKVMSAIMLLILALGVLALVFSDVGSSITGGGGTTQANDPTMISTDHGKVGTRELEQVIRDSFLQAQQRNPQLTMAAFLASDAFDEVLSSIALREALYSFGTDQGLVASDRMIDAIIASVPEFRNFTGQFDQGTYRQILSQQNISEEAFRERVAKSLIQRQIQLPIGLGMRPSDTMAQHFASGMNERRTGLVGTIPLEALAAGIAPSDAEIAQYYNGNRQRYTLPERRVVRYAVLGREQFGDAVKATDAEIEAYYRTNAARFAGSETRSLQQVQFPDEAAARAFMARLQGGAAFAHPNLVTLDQQTREQFTAAASPELAAAAFGAAEGAVVGPMSTPYGWRVVRVGTIARTANRTLAAARAEIVTEVERGKLQEALRTLVERIEGKASDGVSFEEIARTERLTVAETPAITDAGQAPGTNWQAPAEIAPLLRGAFLIDPENPSPAIDTMVPNERYALVSLARVVPPGVQPLAQVRDRVRADVVRTRAAERAQALARRIVEQVNGGMPLPQAFAQAGVRLSPPTAVDVRRDVLFTQAPSADLIAFFGTRQGRAREVQDPSGRAWYIVQVRQRMPEAVTCAPAERNARPATRGCTLIRESLQMYEQTSGPEYAEQFARAIQRAQPVERDEEAIRTLRERLATGAR